jgi:type VI protein secretion system component Hcp
MLIRTAIFVSIGAVTALSTSAVAANAEGKGDGSNVTRQELTVSKTTDASSPKLYEALHNGTHFPKRTNSIKGGSTYDKHKDW